ncbi:MAG: NADH-quinone oxidoreductase subunit H [Deltaproteobacteria bacterium]|nr:NADH-quinone oxidoreductase subunit H [Deltaproteobacteria bacterium]
MESDPILWGLHLALLLLLPPLFPGVIAKTKAWFAGRSGPPLLQLYFDLFKLFRKGSVESRTVTFIFRIAPIAMCLPILTAGMLIPLIGPAPVHFQGDVVFFAYCLAFARFWLIAAALDTGSSFEGMGASREAAFGALSELSFFLILVVLAILTQNISLSGIFRWESLHATFNPVFLLLFFSFFLILLAENCRIPFDDPNTHLELTMIHEVMVLDNSGPNLGLILYGASVKLFIFMALAVQLVWPGPPFLFWIKMVGLAIGIGVVESANARLRLSKIPQFLAANFVVTIFALLVAVFGRNF